MPSVEEVLALASPPVIPENLPAIPFPVLTKVDVRPEGRTGNVWTFFYSDGSAHETRDAAHAECLCRLFFKGGMK